MKLNDQELVRNYMQGDESALEVLIRRHKDKVYTSIILFVRDTPLAEDIFQDTFMKVIHTLRSGQYKEEGKFLPWVMRIAHNLCVDHFRRNKRTPVVDNDDDEFDIFDVIQLTDRNVEDDIIREETYHKVRQLVQHLPPEQKQVIILRHYADLSFKEISEITGVSINTALGRMRYALINIRKMMAEKHISL